MNLSLNYNELNQETKLFLNKAMDIYSLIKDKNIVKSVRLIFERKNHEFTKLDKKVLSLFIAGFLNSGKLKEILFQYNDIKLEDLLDFVNIKKDDIVPLENDKYEEFYNNNLRLDLISILRERNVGNEIKIIAPEVIIASLRFIRLSGSKILDFFSNEYNVECCSLGFDEHPVFKALTDYNILTGNVIKTDLSKTDLSIKDLFKTDLPKKTDTRHYMPSLYDFSYRESNVYRKEHLDNQQQTSINFDDENIWLLLDEIQKKFVGQELAAEGLFYNIINNQQLAQNDETLDGERSIIFLDGPSGTGKTAITREIGKKLDIPFIATPVINYSSTGYVGGDITDTLKDLYKKANGNLEKAQRGIIVFDEFDKIAYSRSGGLEMKKAVQQQLLDFLGGGKYRISVGNSLFDRREIEFDTSKLTFVCLAALTDLRSQKIDKKQAIGFEQSSQQNEQQEYSITPNDIMGIGIEKELVGRLNTYLHTDDYSREALARIFKESTISPLVGFRHWIESKGKKLEIEEDVYDLIVDQAYELNTGARSLQTVMNNIRTHFIKEVLRGTNETIYLDTATVEKINGQMMNRKGRA